MRLKYSLKLREEEVDVTESLQEGTVTIDGVIVAWTSENGKLRSMDLILEKATMQLTREGTIEASGKDIGKMIGIGKYLADRILVQTNIDAINIESSFDGSPEMSPESIEEEEEFTKRRKMCYKLHASGWKSISNFNPVSYPDGYRIAEAFADYADGLRAIHEKSKIVFFYRVLENFSKKPDSVQPGSFSKYASKFNGYQSYTSDKIRDLSKLRNNSAHACSKHKPQNSYIEELRKLSILFLENPPKHKLK